MLGFRKILLIGKLRDVPCFNNNKNDNIHIFLTFVFRSVFVDIIGVDFRIFSKCVHNARNAETY